MWAYDWRKIGYFCVRCCLTVETFFSCSQHVTCQWFAVDLLVLLVLLLETLLCRMSEFVAIRYHGFNFKPLLHSSMICRQIVCIFRSSIIRQQQAHRIFGVMVFNSYRAQLSPSVLSSVALGKHACLWYHVVWFWTCECLEVNRHTLRHTGPMWVHGLAALAGALLIAEESGDQRQPIHLIL